jgi:hypothetical protein
MQYVTVEGILGLRCLEWLFTAMQCAQFLRAAVFRRAVYCNVLSFLGLRCLEGLFTAMCSVS